MGYADAQVIIVLYLEPTLNCVNVAVLRSGRSTTPASSRSCSRGSDGRRNDSTLKQREEVGEASIWTISGDQVII